MTKPHLTPSRRRKLEEACRLVQTIRLEEIAAGKRQPATPREEFYFRLLKAGAKPAVEEFILSRALLILEGRGMLNDPVVDGAEPIPVDYGGPAAA